jgi:hypothetical protein
MVNAVDSANYESLHEIMPREVMNTIFSRLKFDDLLKVTVTCRYWNQIVIADAHTEVRQLTQQIGVSILPQGALYPVLFSIKVYTAVIEANEGEVFVGEGNMPALMNIVLRLAQEGKSQEALDILDCLEDAEYKNDILSDVLFQLAEDNQFEVARDLIKVIQQDEAEGDLAPPIVAALRDLVEADQIQLAEKLFNCAMSRKLSARVRDKDLQRFQRCLKQQGHSDIVEMVGGIRKYNAAQLRALD